MLTSPSRETKIPLPSGILFPEKEKPSAADPLELNVKSLLAASPPEIFKIHPLWLNWNPAIGISVLYFKSFPSR